MSDAELLVEVTAARALALSLWRNGSYDENGIVQAVQSKYGLQQATTIWIVRHARYRSVVLQDEALLGEPASTGC